jgi:hypothetical protein
MLHEYLKNMDKTNYKSQITYLLFFYMNYDYFEGLCIMAACFCELFRLRITV